jgi:hypothetical protein
MSGSAKTCVDHIFSFTRLGVPPKNRSRVRLVTTCLLEKFVLKCKNEGGHRAPVSPRVASVSV